MATIINSPDSNGSGITAIIGIVLVIAAVVAFFMYGLPAIQNNKPKDTNINITVPSLNTTDTSPNTAP